MGNSTSIDDLTKLVQQFCEARDWDQFHNPKEIAIGLVTESAELLDIFRFKSEEQMTKILSGSKRENVEDEIADILFFLLRFSQLYSVDLKKVLSNKMEKNNVKYPVDKVKGLNKKYDEY